MKLIVALIIILLPFLNGCKKSAEKCSSTADADILDVQGPASGMINQDLKFTAAIGLSGGCAHYAGLDNNQTGNTIIINAKINFEGCECTEIYGIDTVNYIFRAATAGNYLFRFKNGNAGFIEKNVMVQ